MKATERAIVLSASQYSFKDKDDKTLEGCSVHYILTDNLAPHSDGERPIKGYKPAKATLRKEAYDTIREVPGLYNLEVELKPGSDGKLAGSVLGLEFVGLLAVSTSEL